MRKNCMSTQDKARELMVQQRQHDEHLHESMLNRAEAAHPAGTDAMTQEEARDDSRLQQVGMRRAQAAQHGVGARDDPTVQLRPGFGQRGRHCA